MYKLFLAFRFLSRRLINVFAVLGVMLAVMALIIVPSVMRGFEREIRARIRGTLAHVILKAHDVNGFDGYQAQMESVAAMEGVAAVAPRCDRYGLLAVGDRDFIHVVFKGIDLDAEAKTTELFDNLLLEDNEALKRSALNYYRGVFQGMRGIQGWDEERQQAYKAVVDRLAVKREDLVRQFPGPEPPGAIVGFSLASSPRQGIKPGDWITVMIPVLRSDEPTLAAHTLRVVGVFKTGNTQYDSSYIYLPLAAMQEATKTSVSKKAREREAARVTAIGVRLKDYGKANAMVQAITERTFGAPFRVETWEEEQRVFLQAVRLERRLQTFIMSFLLIVAAFLISSLLTMSATEKTRDIGTLKALGATSWGVVSVFLMIGLLIGVIGSAAGVAAGCAISINVNAIEDAIFYQTGVRFFPRDVYYLDEVPHEIHWPSIVGTVVAAIALSVMAAVYPAWKAARMRPVETLRYE